MRRKKYVLRKKLGDFQVEEVVDLKPSENGRFSIYRLEKEGLDTYSALKIVAHRTGVPFKAIGYAGLKDRYSKSVQYISLPKTGEKQLDFREKSMSLSLVCQSDRPLRIGIHGGNNFTITIRGMTRDTLEELRKGIEELKKVPLPNYFDSQRFGSIRGAKEFFAVPLIKGEYENALKLILTSTYRKERSPIKALKRSLAENWGDWKACLEILSKGPRYENYNQIFSFLAEKPGDFKGAVKTVRRHVLKMGFSAFQSYVWNEALKSQLVFTIGVEKMFPVWYEAGELLFPRHEAGALDSYREAFKDRFNESMSMPHYKVREDNKHFPLIQDAAKTLDVELQSFRRLEDLSVSLFKGERRMFFSAQDLRLLDDGVENEGHFATLSFSLAPGSYATIVIKSLLG